MQSAFNHIRQSLSRLYSLEETNKIASMLLQHITGRSSASILANKNTNLSDKEREKFNLFVERLKKNEPVEYILQKTDFFGLTFEVNQHTLIPRPETEELVEWIINDNYQVSSSTLLDIGTGSGCIAISLAKNLQNCSATAIDISAEALEVAQQNAEKNHVNIRFLQQDILQPIAEQEVNKCSYNIIVSNPPYVCESEKAAMHNNVLQYEPHQALFVPDRDPLIFYRAIGHFALNHLTDNGNLYVEINRALGKETVEIFSQMGFATVELRKDLCGNERIVKCGVQK